MARQALVIEKELKWGVIRYDTIHHAFSYTEKEPRSSEPYADQPVALNIVVTTCCNMNCDYCVAKDFAGIEGRDLIVSENMIRWINQSPFMLLVLTGGEPLMPPYDSISLRLIDSVTDRGVILDTNGTFLPSRQLLARLKKSRVMLRVSMDSARPEEEIERRHIIKRADPRNSSAYFTKLTNIDRFLSAGINTAVQTVVWRNNVEPLYQMIDWLVDHRIKRWYLQRLIPSYKFKYPSRYALGQKDYYSRVNAIVSKARKAGIQCIPKMDLRHNSVFLLVADGVLYTQGPAPGQKVRLGTIRDHITYFEYVSAADHACRYYIPDAQEGKTEGDLADVSDSGQASKQQLIRKRPSTGS